MPRIQIVPLPAVPLPSDAFGGPAERIPFIVILDKVDIGGGHAHHYAEHVERATGAALVIIDSGEWEAPGQLELSDEQREHLIAWLTQPTQVQARGGIHIPAPGSSNTFAEDDHPEVYIPLDGEHRRALGILDETRRRLTDD